MASITRWNVEGAPDRPKAILISKTAKRSYKSGFIFISSRMGMFQYAFSMSNNIKYLLSAMSERLLLMSGMGYTGVIVTEFNPRKSVQNLYFGVPSGDFLGTRIKRAAQGDAQGVMTPLSQHLIQLASHFIFLCIRHSIRVSLNRKGVPCPNLMTAFGRAWQHTGFLITK
jgi:hypothetical protein